MMSKSAAACFVVGLYSCWLVESFQLVPPVCLRQQRICESITSSALQPSDDMVVAVLSPMESWYAEDFKSIYERALTIRCPFFRRRASDFLDSVDEVIRFLVIRHKTLIPPPPGWRCKGDTSAKQIHLSKTELLQVVRHDWCTSSNKGYYITGKVTTSIYRDDCLFEGPDPDMPVRGLRKYLNAASQLFDHRHSSAELLGLEIGADDDTIVATWRLQGILRLPWRPQVPEWTGRTVYHTDEDGLIVRHVETWDISAMQAFLETLWPECAALFWRGNRRKETTQ